MTAALQEAVFYFENGVLTRWSEFFFAKKYDSLKIMEFKFPKNDDKYYWTNHVGRKMMFYGLSADRIKRVIRSPQRSEKGIAEGTIAVMQPTGSKKPSEVWVMYAQKSNKKQETRNKEDQIKNKSLVSGRLSRKIIITAWRYPGISKIRDEIPIPADILAELKEEGVIRCR